MVNNAVLNIDSSFKPDLLELNGVVIDVKS